MGGLRHLGSTTLSGGNSQTLIIKAFPIHAYSPSGQVWYKLSLLKKERLKEALRS